MSAQSDSVAKQVAAFLDLHAQRHSHDVIMSLAVGDGRTVELTRSGLNWLLSDRAGMAEDAQDAESYRYLRDEISATMADDAWDLDGSESWILAEYVRWLAAGAPRDEDGRPDLRAVNPVTRRADGTCRWCGVVKSKHPSRWGSGLGGHDYAPPTTPDEKGEV